MIAAITTARDYWLARSRDPGLSRRETGNAELIAGYYSDALESLRMAESAERRSAHKRPQTPVDAEEQ